MERHTRVRENRVFRIAVILALALALNGVSTVYGVFYQDDSDGGGCPWWYVKPPYSCNGSNNDTECAQCFRNCDTDYSQCLRVFRGAEGKLLCQADRNARRGACIGEAQGCGSSP